MVIECTECRRWEEEMYWSRFQTVQFCQFLSGRFHHQLAIPEKFGQSLKEKLAGTVALKGPSGHVWNVGVMVDGDKLLLKHGWNVFVEDHSLKENDIVIFRYHGNSMFDVMMFDQETLCEKSASYFVKKCDHSSIDDRGTKRMRSFGGLDLDDTNILEDVANCHRAKTPITNDAARTPPSRTQPARSTTKGQRGTKKSKQGSSGAYPLQLKSRRREVTEEEKEKVKRMAVEAASTDNSFIVVMRASHVYKGFFMSIPAEWVKVHLPTRSQNVELRVGDNKWQAKYLFKGYGGGLSGGWKNFVLENFLEESDVCVFDLESVTRDVFILDVKIFRVVEEVIPPSVVSREPARHIAGKRRPTKDSLELSSEEEDG
ncbi:hypothetical protein C2S51_016280 [Perilla frutescens var. frutescens]|nr:hypothetical protein C2S51_016280 [Perilla frutescens var. frutescens]